MGTYTTLIPKPDPKSVNGGRSPLHQKTVLRLIGPPCSNPPVNGGGMEVVTNKKLKPKLVTMQVHSKFKLTGHIMFLSAIKRGLDALNADHPDLYNQIGTEGALWVRYVRGSRSSWSNHAFGFAADFTIGGKLDERGDDMVQSGMLIVYSYMKQEGIYWGVEFPTEDGMHFEASDELILKWAAEGMLVAA